MSEQSGWKQELETYIRQGEPGRAEKSAAWQTAIGLQDVDGLKTSAYLLETAKEHIEGRLTMSAAKERIRSYYEQRKDRQAVKDRTMEADLVSVRIAELLGEKTFRFSPAFYIHIHRRLFDGVFPHAGQLRTCNITKKERVLNGESVYYATYDSIWKTLEYDFGQEKQFSYQTVAAEDAVKHIAAFASGIWQIHPFCEGNTRSTAVFIIQYMKTFGFHVGSDIFAENAGYFRNALVRANYSNLRGGVHAAPEYLEAFFENMLIGTHHELKNRYLHIDYGKNPPVQRAGPGIPKCKNCTLDCTLEELAILRAIQKNPCITQKAMAAALGKSERTIKSKTVVLQEKGYIQRKNGKRNGYWELLADL